jgi:TRAP-type C4-dicarboxylate transport system permease small subunit
MRALDRIYAASGAAAALFLAAIAVVVLAQILCRLLGVKIVGADDFAAWSMAAAAFLALPQALTKGDHIRVSVVVERLPSGAAKAVDLAAEIIGFALSAWAAWSVAAFVATSYALHDVSQGELGAPLWIPQLSMAAGFLLLAVAFGERLIVLFSGARVAAPAPDEVLRVE